MESSARCESADGSLRYSGFEMAGTQIFRDRKSDQPELLFHRALHAIFFAGKLESGNVCEYFVMMQMFHDIGITEHDELLYEMGVKEKEHEVFFAEMIKDARWLPMFEKIFNWGEGTSLNDVDVDDLKPVEESGEYCESRKISPRS